MANKMKSPGTPLRTGPKSYVHPWVKLLLFSNWSHLFPWSLFSVLVSPVRVTRCQTLRLETRCHWTIANLKEVKYIRSWRGCCPTLTLATKTLTDCNVPTNCLFSPPHIKWKRQIVFFFVQQWVISVSRQLLAEIDTFAMLKLFPSAEYENWRWNFEKRCVEVEGNRFQNTKLFNNGDKCRIFFPFQINQTAMLAKR